MSSRHVWLSIHLDSAFTGPLRGGSSRGGMELVSGQPPALITPDAAAPLKFDLTVSSQQRLRSPSQRDQSVGLL